MKVIVEGKRANKRILVPIRDTSKARAYIRKTYGDVEVFSMPYTEKTVALYWYV